MASSPVPAAEPSLQRPGPAGLAAGKADQLWRRPNRTAAHFDAGAVVFGLAVALLGLMAASDLLLGDGSASTSREGGGGWWVWGHWVLDGRSVALCRMLLGLLLLVDLAERWADRHSFYTDHGCAPRPLVLAGEARPSPQPSATATDGGLFERKD